MELKYKLKTGEAREKCAGYFERCQKAGQVPTAPGLALALGLEGRAELEALAKGEGRTCAMVRRALSQVEEANIQAAYKRDSGPSARFILQNGFGYSEKPRQEAPPGVIQVRLTGEECDG